jgi:hypothetical protein
MEKMDKLEVFFYLALPALMLGAVGLVLRYLFKLSQLYLNSQGIKII